MGRELLVDGRPPQEPGRPMMDLLNDLGVRVVLMGGDDIGDSGSAAALAGAGVLERARVRVRLASMFHGAVDAWLLWMDMEIVFRSRVDSSGIPA
jgi:hypothetical protein